MFLPRKTNTTLDKILDLSWRRIPIARPIRRGALSFRVKPFFFFFISIRMSWFQNHTAWPKLKQWLSQMKLIWPPVAATLLIFHNRYNGKFEGRLAQKSLRHKEECTKTGRLSFVKTRLGKISAQPTQICFPNGNVLFLSLFFLSKNWMQNVE